tara:strand:+ start:26 stop:631 length:606 start_codon:yes stop_codon:yes gene_type:complete
MLKNNPLVLVFCKNQIIGKVKSRLALKIGQKKAFLIYSELVNKTASIVNSLSSEVHVYYSDYIEENDKFNSSKIKKFIQKGNNLGDRIINALNISFKNFSPVVVIGSDLWKLEISDIEDTFRILKNKNVVIGPSNDGGYYLIGMNYLDTKIFENKNWGQESVLNDTIRDIDDKTNIHLLDEKTDIDTYNDLCQFPDLKIKL